MLEVNGTATKITATEVKELEEVSVKTDTEPKVEAKKSTRKSKSTKKSNTTKTETKKSTRKVKLPELFIDGGSARTKYFLNKISGAYQSVAREFPKNHELPTGYLGVFRLGDKGYAVGDSALSLGGGTLHEGYANDNKIKLLGVWIVGALTTHPDFLFRYMKKQIDGVIEIEMKLSLLSLSSHRKQEIEKAIKNISFIFDDREFKITIKDYSLYPEGYGAAVVAKKWLKTNKHNDSKFHVLDLGGGTLTHTPYSNLNGVPRAASQKSVSGAGVLSITEFFGNEATKGDTGGNIYHFHRLREALESSEVLEDGSYSAEIVLGQGFEQLGDRLQSGLEAWSREIIGVRELLRDMRQIIRKGERIFLTGGGFAVPAISHYVKKYLGDSESVIVLDNPQDVNITGIKS